MENKVLENDLDILNKLKKKKHSLDIKYNQILQSLKGAKSGEDIVKYQKELIKLSKEYDIIAQKLKQ